MNTSFKFQVQSFKSNFVAFQSPKLKWGVTLDFGLWTFLTTVVTMALARILVDGYSLLHNWPELARRPAASFRRARANELIHVLTHYHDATGEPVTVFFDGSGAPPGTPTRESNRGGGSFVFARGTDRRSND